MTATIEAPEAEVVGKRSRRPQSTDGIAWIDPRVDLMPPEIRRKRKQDKLIGRMGLALVVVVVVVAVAILGALLYATSASARLAEEQSRTMSLLQQQQQYADVRSVQSQIALTEAAQQVGGSTEIDWNDLLGKVGAVTPPGVMITTISVDAMSPMTSYTQALTPLSKPAVAGVTLTAASAAVPEASSWITALKGVEGVAAVDLTSVVAKDGAGFTSTVVLQIDESAFDDRFAPKEGE